MIINMLGYAWDDGLCLQKTHTFRAKNLGYHYKLANPPRRGRFSLYVSGDRFHMLDWVWGEPHFWDAGRQGGHAQWAPAEQLTLYRPFVESKDPRIMICDTWLGFGGFFHKAQENLEEVFLDLVQKIVDAFVQGISPAEAAGYPGPDWPFTMNPRYTRGRGPAKSEVKEPQQFLDRNQQPSNDIITPKSITGE